MLPSEISSSPAIIRSVVDLPQPEGPTRTTNSLSGTERLKSLTTGAPRSYRLKTFSKRTLPMGRGGNCGGKNPPPIYGVSGAISTPGRNPAVSHFVILSKAKDLTERKDEILRSLLSLRMTYSLKASRSEEHTSELQSRLH